MRLKWPKWVESPAVEPWRTPYEATTTVEDIAGCFRLLLGRAPNPEEWAGHSQQAGQPLPGIVAGYLGSLEFSRRGLLAPPARSDIALAVLPDFQIYAAESDAAVGHHVRRNNYEPDVTAVFRRLLRPGMRVIDIGANIGYFTMLSAALVGPSGRVLAIEPNARNARLLEASRRANAFGHVTLAQVAAGPDTGLLVLHATHSNGTTSELPHDLDMGEAGNIGRLLTAETVPCLRVDALVSAHEKIDLIKADVEGAEYRALLGCRDIIGRDHPTIITEFSPDLMPGISGIDGVGYLAWLVEQGYGLAVIQQDGTTSDAGQSPEAVMQAYRERGTDHLDLIAERRT